MPAEAMDVDKKEDKDKKPDEKDKKPEPAPPPVPLTLKQGGQSRHHAQRPASAQPLPDAAPLFRHGLTPHRSPLCVPQSSAAPSC